jgi:diguanylate cyclase
MIADDVDVLARAQGEAEHEWAGIWGATSPAVRKRVAKIVAAHKESIARRFYTAMMGDMQARHFLAHESMMPRMDAALQQWLLDLFGAEQPHDIGALVARHRQIGEVHARIQLPINLVARAARFIKRWIDEYLVADHELDRDGLLEASEYVDDLIDLALELMSMAFVKSSERSARAEEAFRLFSLGQNISLERERQHVALLEWSQQVLFALHRHGGKGDTVLPSLAHSEFGLWLQHKALLMFEGSPEIGQIGSAVERVDTGILPQLKQGIASGHLRDRSAALQQEIAHIKFLLAALFDRYVEIENGRDVLTRLLNRRFLPATLAREIALAQRGGAGFALLLIDLDHFKDVNDAYGHDVGDLVLQQAAALVLNSVRAGDFIFRYGGEEILVMLVEVDDGVARRIAETIRECFDKADFAAGEGRVLHLTASIGVALYDGHPDFQYVIQRADAALYEAKNTGRNRCCVA